MSAIGSFDRKILEWNFKKEHRLCQLSPEQRRTDGSALDEEEQTRLKEALPFPPTEPDLKEVMTESGIEILFKDTFSSQKSPHAMDL